MSSKTTNLDLLKMDPATDGDNTFNIETMLNGNWDKVDEAVGGRETLLKSNPTKTTPADTDSVPLVQASDQKTKRVTWSRIKATLKTYFDDLYAAATHSHAWSAITGKPSTFPPDDHGHVKADILDFPSAMPPTAHSHAWSGITGKPSAFTPTSHSHAWGGITGKPSTFTPSSHNHSASNITSGIFPISRGGTGANTAAGARTKLDAAQPYSGSSSIAISWWSGSTAPFTYSLSVAGMLATDNPQIMLVRTTDEAANKVLEEAWTAANVRVYTTAGHINFVARGDKPTVALPIEYRGSR